MNSTHPTTEAEPSQPRRYLTDRLMIEFQRLRLKALGHLTNLRSYEYCGTTLQTKITTVCPMEDATDWMEVHRKTLEELIQLISVYYLRIHEVPFLQLTFLQTVAAEMPDLPPHPDNITFEETHEVTEPCYRAPSLDIRALEMMSVDMLVDQLYQDPLILRDPRGFATRVPILCEYFRTPLFHSSQQAFYELVIAAFDQHPDRARAPWHTTSPLIHQVRFASGNPVIGQISTTEDPFA